ncbi:MAG TPA: hypothetical protein VFS20_14655, partial [Longimicrobium sp.]|nr:hypothetical protein [Longimicrobium sp.]
VVRGVSLIPTGRHVSRSGGIISQLKELNAARCWERPNSAHGGLKVRWFAPAPNPPLSPAGSGERPPFAPRRGGRSIDAWRVVVNRAAAENGRTPV